MINSVWPANLMLLVYECKEVWTYTPSRESNYYRIILVLLNCRDNYYVVASRVVVPLVCSFGVWRMHFF